MISNKLFELNKNLVHQKTKELANKAKAVILHRGFIFFYRQGIRAGIPTDNSQTDKVTSKVLVTQNNRQICLSECIAQRV